MATSRMAGREPPLHWFQRMLDSITFLVLLGVAFPTGLYTVWSIVELRDLPSFGEAPHGALHGTLPAAAEGVPPAAAAAVAPSGAAANAADGSAGSEAATGVAVVTATPPADAIRVSMRNMAFQPRTLEVPAGATVTWVNDDPFDHAVASGTPDTPAAERAFVGSGDFGQGGSFSVTFHEPGTYEIYCSTPGHFAAGMVMTLIVTEVDP